MFMHLNKFKYAKTRRIYYTTRKNIHVKYADYSICSDTYCFILFINTIPFFYFDDTHLRVSSISLIISMKI